MKSNDLDHAFIHYIATALWCSMDREKYLDNEYSIDDLSDDTQRELKLGLESFVDKYFDLVAPTDINTSIETFVHNFWLTRNGHGAGFWDGDYKNGDELTTACEKLGQVELYVGDDGKIYK